MGKDKVDFVIVGDGEGDAKEEAKATDQPKADSKPGDKTFEAVMVTILGGMAANKTLTVLRETTGKAPNGAAMAAATAIASGKVIWALQCIADQMEKTTPGYRGLMEEAMQSAQAKKGDKMDKIGDALGALAEAMKGK